MTTEVIGRAVVVSVSSNPDRGLRKLVRHRIVVVPDHGVEGDVHYGRTARHVARMKKDPNQPNLRQVHLLHEELLEDLRGQGISVGPGAMGENILTRGIDLLDLRRNSLLRIGSEAVLRVAGLRNPCRLLDEIDDAVLPAVRRVEEDGSIQRLTGVMTVVEVGGEVKPGDRIQVLAVGRGVLEPV